MNKLDNLLYFILTVITLWVLYTAIIYEIDSKQYIISEEQTQLTTRLDRIDSGFNSLELQISEYQLDIQHLKQCIQ